MPAVTADPVALPRIPAPTLGDVERPVRSVTTAPSGYEGEGFPVRRAFAGVSQRALDPFIHMDQMGEVEYAPGEPKGTAWHPHRGFETVTYMIDGEMAHQDSHGGGGLITSASGGLSMCSRPDPAVIHWVSPSVMTPPPPSESECSKVPSSMYVTVSKPRCGCHDVPRGSPGP